MQPFALPAINILQARRGVIYVTFIVVTWHYKLSTWYQVKNWFFCFRSYHSSLSIFLKWTRTSICKLRSTYFSCHGKWKYLANMSTSNIMSTSGYNCRCRRDERDHYAHPRPHDRNCSETRFRSLRLVRIPDFIRIQTRRFIRPLHSRNRCSRQVSVAGVAIATLRAVQLFSHVDCKRNASRPSRNAIFNYCRLERTACTWR